MNEGASIQDDWWNTDYADNILEVLKEKEETITTFQSQSPQLYMRRCLVDWLALIVNKYSISDTSCHLAVRLLDYFMDNHEIVESRLQLVALGCLSVACKFDEIDCKIPRLSELNKLTCNSYTLHDFLQIELIILEFFNWELFKPTAAHFSDYYIQYSVSSQDLVAGRPTEVLAQFQNNVKKYVKYFLDVSLQDCAFIKMKPSLVASSSIAATRVHLLVSPTWPTQLQKLTKYSFQELIPCVHLMLHALDSDKAAARASIKRKFDTDDEDDDDDDDVDDDESPGQDSPLNEIVRTTNHLPPKLHVMSGSLLKAHLKACQEQVHRKTGTKNHVRAVHQDQKIMMYIGAIIADESSIPIILYSVPANTTIDMDPDVVVRLSKHPQIVGMKDSGGDISKLAYMVHKTKESGFQIFAGSAGFLMPAIDTGCVGGIMAVANVLGPQTCELLQLLDEGKRKAAIQLQHRLVAPNWAVTKKYGIPGLKYAMELFGYYGGPLRSPLQSLTDNEKANLKSTFQDSGFIKGG